MIYYITTNHNKIITANRYLNPFGITLESLKIEGIVEPQSEDIVEISKYKAQQAFREINKPLLVSDSSWIIPALNGFPGPYMASVNKWLTSQDFLNLMKDKEDKRIIVKECVTYIDEDQIKTFTSETEGFFIEEPKGEATAVDQVISFRDDRKTTAQCENEGIMRIPQSDLWNNIGVWLKENSKPSLQE